MAKASVKLELERIRKSFPLQKDSHHKYGFSLKSVSPDEICLLFKDKKSHCHIINCTITEAYPLAKPIWYSDTEDKKVTEVMEELSKIDFQKNSQLTDMVQFLVSSITEKFGLDPSTAQFCPIESGDRKTTTSTTTASSTTTPSMRSMRVYACGDDTDTDSDDDDDEEEEDDPNDVSDLLVEEIVKAETEKARKEDNEISPQNQQILVKMKAIQTQKQIKGSMAAGSVQASDRLMKELRAIYRSDSLKKGFYSVDLVNDSLYEWHVNIMKVDSDSPLHEDLKKLNMTEGTSSIVISISFHDNFPFDPPFVRVVRPVLTGGFVLNGGAICMELLTKQGWSSAYSMESLVVQIVATLVKGKARVKFGASKQQYSLTRAKQSYKRLVAIHEENGWYTPPKQDG